MTSPATMISGIRYLFRRTQVACAMEVIPLLRLSARDAATDQIRSRGKGKAVTRSCSSGATEQRYSGLSTRFPILRAGETYWSVAGPTFWSRPGPAASVATRSRPACTDSIDVNVRFRRWRGSRPSTQFRRRHRCFRLCGDFRLDRDRRRAGGAVRVVSPTPAWYRACRP